MEKTDYIKDFEISLNKLEIGELRKKASQQFGIKLTREHKKEDIIRDIVAVVSKANFAEASDGDLKPGYARIKLTTIAGKVTFPVYQNTNGYYCFIPPGIEVDVPIKVVETLRHAEEMKKVQNEFGEYEDVMQPSYPFELIAMNKGPDPKPGYEVQRDMKWKPYREFYEQNGFWPSAKVLEQTRAAGLSLAMFKNVMNPTED